MPMVFNFYVPADYGFKNYFLPKIKHPSLEYFDVDRDRYGIQRKGNNHLVVFLDYCFQKAPSEFTEPKGDGANDFVFEKPHQIEFFNRMFRHQKEVAVYSLSYHARMSVIVWKLLIDITDDEKVMVEDNLGHLMTGPQCAREFEQLLREG